MKTTSVLLLSSIMALACALNPHEVYAQNIRVDWSAFSSGFAVPSFSNTVIKSSMGQVFAGRSQAANNVVESGFLVHPLFRGPLVGVPEEELLPTVYALYQNYPNPFNPSTTISFSLPSKSFVLLKVFDGLGREVAILLSEELSPGTYSKQWNAVGLASGVYFYRLQADDFTASKKLLLLK